MSNRTVISIAAATILGVACVSTDASARAGFHGGAGHAGGFHHGVYGGGYGRGGWHGGYGRGGWGWGAAGAAAVGAAAVGAAVTAPYYYGRPACGYYPYAACY
jgi:hypothetical protein